MIHPLLSSQKGFSILMALGSIGVLLIIVVGMASVFISEMKLSRLQYDNMLSAMQAEGAFEYAMLKIKNHRDGFQDEMKNSSPDAEIFSGASARTEKVKVSYKIESQSGTITYTGGQNNYTIFPLFIGDCNDQIDAESCSPVSFSGISQVTQINELSILGDPANLSWSIVAMNGSKNISISGTGNINGIEVGTMRLQENACFDIDGNSGTVMGTGECPPAYKEEILTYFYDYTGSTIDFLQNTVTSSFSGMSTKNPYLLVFNSGPEANITLKTNSQFTLPQMRVNTEAKKGTSLRSIRFTEDKSRYYDAIKYGIYNQ